MQLLLAGVDVKEQWLRERGQQTESMGNVVTRVNELRECPVAIRSVRDSRGSARASRSRSLGIQCK